MTRAEAFTLALPMAAVVVLCLIGWACERYIRRRPRNRRVRFGKVTSRLHEPFKDDRDWQRLFRESIKP